VNALKHTEGGGEAAKQAVQLESDPKADNEPVEESLYLRKAPLPISDDERTEMLAVLERDASELDEVVTEIRDRNTEQETLFSHLAHMAKGSRKHDTILREALVMLQEMRSLHLPSHLHALSTFQADWIRLRASMQSKTDSLLELATSNEGFIHAYVELLKEVQRRDAVRERIQEIEVKARKEIARLEEGDERARREFVETFGGSLPRGIWDGEDLGR
jgi:autophagy-related protein 17